MRSAGLILASLALAVSGAGAQGSLSAQGLGYPMGQLGTRSLSVGGGTAEVDYLTPLNPAALIAWGGGGLFFQTEPEYRTVSLNGVSDRTRVTRFPVIAAAARLHARLLVGLSASSLLDQTWSTRVDQVQLVGGDSVATASLVRSEGSVTDVRLGASWAPGSVVRIGVAGHLLSGRTRIARQVTFDATGFADVIRLREMTYGGHALSAGVLVVAGSSWIIGASGRLGGAFRVDSGAAVANGDAPSRLGASVEYAGIPDATFSINVERQGWSSVGEFAPGGARNTTEYGFGAEFGGVSLLSREVLLRGGARFRGLPFAVAGAFAEERAIGAGFGIGLTRAGTRGPAVLDFGLLRVSRSGAAGVSESSWLLSTGIVIRP